jgi:hypothetical protein
MPSADLDALIRREFDQAWEHSRHIENQRNQYTGFMFAAVASFAPVVAATESIPVAAATLTLIVLGETALYVLLAGFILLTQRRWTAVYRHYQNVIQEIRHRSADNQTDEFEKVMDWLDVLRDPSVVPSSFFRVSAMSEYLASFVLVSFDLGLLVGGIYDIAHRLDWQSAVGLILALLMTSVATTALLVARGHVAGPTCTS